LEGFVEIRLLDSCGIPVASTAGTDRQ